MKILGILALIDEGETDWKLISIDISDPLAGKLYSVEDIDKYLPGLLKVRQFFSKFKAYLRPWKMNFQATLEWFRNYKIPTGKSPNNFGFDGDFKDAEFAHKVRFKF